MRCFYTLVRVADIIDYQTIPDPILKLRFHKCITATAYGVR